jgi:hypothetical protein
MKIPVVHKKQEELISNKKILFSKEGMDDRGITNNNQKEDGNEALRNIFQNMKKKELLHYLESNQVSFPSKLQEIEKYEKEEKGTCIKYKPNLVAGLFLKDW